MDATANQSGNTTFTVTSNAVTAATASTIAYRDSSADLNVRLLRANYANQSTISGAMAYRVNNSTDNYTRYCSSPSAIRTFLGVPASGDLNSYLLNTTDTFTGSLTIVGDIRGSGQQLILNAGESYSYATGQTAENVYLNAEAGLQINSSPDNWGSGWAGRNTAHINKADGSSIFPGAVGIATTSIGTGRTLDVNGDTMVRGHLFVGETGSTAGETKVKIGQNRASNGYAYIDLIGDAAATSYYNLRLIRNNTGVNATSQIIHTGTGNFSIDTSDSADIILNPGTANVGIGTTSPIGKLNINTGLTGVSYDMVSQANGSISFSNNSGGTAVPTITGKSDNNVGLMFTSGTNNTGSVADMYFDVRKNDNTDYTTLTKPAYKFNRAANALMTILRSGDVGIGTISPNQKLHVNGATQLGNINSLTSFGTVALKVVEGTVSTGPTLGSGTVGAQAVLYSDGLFGMYTGVATNGDTWMQSQRNDANTAAYDILLNPLGGKVGIGTITPGYTLDVSGNARFSATTRHDAGLYTSGTQTRNKLSVWSSLSTYTIGMKSGFGYGGLGGDSTGTDYAMSFQMSNSNYRGWWWGDSSHTDLQGAMSLTTQGKLVVATSIAVGAGESTRTAGTSKLTVVAPLSSNGVGTDFQIVGGSGYSFINLQVEIPGYGTGVRFQSNSTSSLDNIAQEFYQGTSKVGSIVINTSSTSFNTTSDYRLKENREDILDAIERVKELKPTKFNWIKEPNGSKVDGFYAHELAEVVPEAVTGKKDDLDYEGNPDYQAIDQSKIVPLLTAALQQAIDKIEALEQRIQLIENK
jgi:hypothetical protein